MTNELGRNEPSWSPVDADGMTTCWLTPRERSTLKGRRLRKAATFRVPLLDAWPERNRELLAAWLKQRGDRIRHDTLLKQAGSSNATLAATLVAELLHAGALEVEEHFQRGTWQIAWLRFLEAPTLAKALGLPDPAALRQAWEAARAHRFGSADLQAAADELQALPPGRALPRFSLLESLSAWRDQGRSGTWRDLAQFARGDTKALTQAEKDWLERSLDIQALGISGHEPLLLISAPLRLGFEGSHLDLAAAGDFLGLTPRSLQGLNAAEGKVGVWHLVENRTSFERVARERKGGTVWLPGFPPSWWRQAMATILSHAPAPALIACDPDPAGLDICMQAGAVWTGAGLAWEPWHMSPEDLNALPVRKPLTERDKDRLKTLLAGPLPHDQLRELGQHMLDIGEKGEQEAGL